MRLYEIRSTGTLPMQSFDLLWHVGSMNEADKGKDSHEGAGLSVSSHPEAWRRIARGHVNGELWKLSKSGNRFLDVHRLGPAQREHISEWAARSGLATSSTVYRVQWQDDESGGTTYVDFPSRSEADEEAEMMGVEPFAVPGQLLATDHLRERTKSRAEPAAVFDLLCTVFVEDVLGIDGVWWQDKLDVASYSAPRGVIVPSKLSGWTVSKADPR